MGHCNFDHNKPVQQYIGICRSTRPVCKVQNTGYVTGRLILAVTGVRTGSLAVLVLDISMLFVNP
jgi:hypothetical protein